jgi:N-acetylglutamate synthase-like GNAT family acetyltransferase
MNTIVVRPMRLIDAEGIAGVHVLSWKDTYKGLIPDEMLDNLNIPDRTNRWKETIVNTEQKWKGLVAEEKGKVIGWATYGKPREENIPERMGELWAIYVHPESLKKGAGSLLMEECLNGLKKMGYKSAYLWVLTTNIKSREWYEKKGWKKTEEIKLDKRGDHELHETKYVIDLPKR